MPPSNTHHQIGRGVTHTRIAGRRGRDASMPSAATSSGGSLPGQSLPTQRVRHFWRRAPQPRRAIRVLWLATEPQRHRGTSMRGQASRLVNKPLMRWLQARESNPRPTVSQTVALPTELTCWLARPRPRAIHASAIHSASAPGGTPEPAPLTRFRQPDLCTTPRSRAASNLFKPGPRKRRGPGGQCRPGPRWRFGRQPRAALRCREGYSVKSTFRPRRYIPWGRLLRARRYATCDGTNALKWVLSCIRPRNIRFVLVLSSRHVSDGPNRP